MQSWIIAIAAAIQYLSRTIFLEYRGREIVDPEDAKEIVQASTEIKQFVFGEYDTAHKELLQVSNQLAAATRRHQKVHNQARRLARQIKQLRQQLADQQAHYAKLSQQLSDFSVLKKKSDRSRRALMVAVADLHERLEQTDPHVLPRVLAQNAELARSALQTLAEANLLETDPAESSSSSSSSSLILPKSPSPTSALGNFASLFARVKDLTEVQLLAVSNKQLEHLQAEIQSLAGSEHIQLRQESSSLLLGNAAMRIKMNSYAEHIVILTQRKLEQFDQDFDQNLN